LTIDPFHILARCSGLWQQFKWWGACRHLG
jgi:hypothetical protein